MQFHTQSGMIHALCAAIWVSGTPINVSCCPASFQDRRDQLSLPTYKFKETSDGEQQAANCRTQANKDPALASLFGNGVWPSTSYFGSTPGKGKQDKDKTSKPKWGIALCLTQLLNINSQCSGFQSCVPLAGCRLRTLVASTSSAGTSRAVQSLALSGEPSVCHMSGTGRALSLILNKLSSGLVHVAIAARSH
eukprot:3304882-Amphidinium_carterae.1